MEIMQIIGRFKNVKQMNENSYQCQCSAHKDDKASLTITKDGDKILMHCHAGCDTKQILASVGLTEKDLFNEEKKVQPRIVAEYIYKDEEGNTLYKVIRYEPKNFVQSRYVNGKWVYKMGDVRHVLYNLPNVVKANEVYFVEGEKDADNLNRLGLTATTSAGGAAGFRKEAKGYVESLKGKTVYIIPDNDKPGYSYASDIETALKGVAKEVKVLKLVEEVKDLKEKSDISDVIKDYGTEKALEIIEKLKNIKEGEVVKDEVELTSESIFSPDLIEKLYEMELQDIEKFVELYGKIKIYCTEHRLTGFDKMYRMFKESKKAPTVQGENVIVFPEMEDKKYTTNRYQLQSDGCIYEVIPEVGQILVCYHPILPVEKLIDFEDGREKVKLAFYKQGKWRNIITDKSTISSAQSIVKLSDLGIEVTSETGKYLVKYLAEIGNLNEDKLDSDVCVSRLGWFDGALIPYSDKFQLSEEGNMKISLDSFKEKGDLRDWIEFFAERRKYNPAARIIMAASVISIFLKQIQQPGFTLHIWGESEKGKSVACMAAKSIFGNPSDEDGIGINFNMTNSGLEYKLNFYNNIPLFINEMQHQKDAQDYDKILYLISEGKGKTRSTKNGGLQRENSWRNIVITNGEKDIIKDNSNAGAYNRCLSIELTDYSYENLKEVADFSRENYGTAIREILRETEYFDVAALFKVISKDIENNSITNKQRLIESLVLTGDKLVTDILFKDDYYLTQEDVEQYIIKKDQTNVEQRAFEVTKDWIITNKRHFLGKMDVPEGMEPNVDIYGKRMDGKIAIIPNELKKVLQNNGFDYKEIVSAWKRKGYTKCERNRNTIKVKIDGDAIRCVVLFLVDEDSTEEEEEEEIPF